MASYAAMELCVFLELLALHGYSEDDLAEAVSMACYELDEKTDKGLGKIPQKELSHIYDEIARSVGKRVFKGGSSH